MLNRYVNFIKKVSKRAQIVGIGKSIYLCLLEKFCFNMYKKRIYNFLEEFFNEELKTFQNVTIDELKECDEKYVFVCWWQGEDNAPTIVKRCINSIRRFCVDYEAKFVLIDQWNYRKWVNFPEIIINKIGSKISITEFSDLLRMGLLKRYGGVWIDSTIFYSGKIERAINPFTQVFFSQKYTVYPDRYVNISEGMWASYIQGTKYINFPLYVLAEKMYIHYYTVYDTNLDYFIIDYIMRVCYEHIEEIKKSISNLPSNNSRIFWLYQNAYTIGREKEFSKIRKNTMFHKLNWRFDLDREENTLIYNILNTNF